MGEQMNSKEASIFERLQQETKVGLLAWMVEELRVRDLRVFIAGASVAKKIDIYGQIPKDESSDEFVVATILAGGRDILALEPEGEARILAETGKCTLERALIVEARRAKGVVGNQIETVNSVSTVHYRADLLLLARLEHVSKLRRDVRRQSQLEAPGDADHFNVVWEEWRRDDRIIDSDHKLTGILDYIGEKIPTEFAKEVGKPPRLKH